MLHHSTSPVRRGGGEKGRKSSLKGRKGKIEEIEQLILLREEKRKGKGGFLYPYWRGKKREKKKGKKSWPPPGKKKKKKKEK